MAFTEQSELREVRGISETEESLIKAFMQGAIYCWVKNRAGESFAVRDLMGGKNTDWSGTPLQALYDKHSDAGKDDESAAEDAAKDLGWLVKRVLADDKRTFAVGKAGLVSSYRWIDKE